MTSAPPSPPSTASRAGVALEAVGTPEPRGLVVGYANLPEAGATAAVASLAAAIEATVRLPTNPVT